jgi:transposase
MERRPATAEEARALANPLRLRILRLCLNRGMTNEELATRLGRDAGTVLHHVRMLVETGFLAPDGERRGPRGSVERPYRATGKSWTLSVGEQGDDGGTLALVDAFREELAEVPADWVRHASRFGTRLTPEVLAGFETRLAAMIDELVAADDPAGEPYGMFIGVHRRAD